MQKPGINYTSGSLFRVLTGKNIFFIMKISLIVLAGTFLSINMMLASPGYTQDYENKNIHLNYSNSSLAEVFKGIESQVKVVFSYEMNRINQKGKVTIVKDNITVADALNLLLKGKHLAWEIRENIITIKEPDSSGSNTGAVGHKFTAPFFSAALPPVTGVITDEEGNPLPGISVTVKGTKNGATTDINGRFNIEAQPNITLIISSVEYEAQEYKLSGTQQSIAVTLKKKVSSLLEVVVNKGYYNTKEALNTGNVTTVSGKDIEKQPVSNVLEALGGRVPGVYIAQSSGFSNTGIKVLIQGQNSLRNGIDPFYVVDGVPYSSQMLFNLNTIGGQGNPQTLSGGGNPLNFLNQSDIESVTVLKDADATAIYGSRAANGAILITTKKGRAGQMRVDLKVQNGWGKVGHKMKVMNTRQYLQMRHETLKNDGITAPGPGDYDLNGTWDTTRNTDWQKVLIGNTAKYQDYNVSVSGGNELTQYLIGGAYHKETTVFPVDFPDIKASAHFSIISSSANKKFRIQMTGNYMNDYNRLPREDQTRYALLLAPVMPSLYNADGSINWAPDANGNTTFSFQQPAANLLNRYKGKTNNLIGNVLMSYEIIHDLNIRLSAGYTNLQTDEVATYPLAAISPENRPYNDRVAYYNTSNANSWIIEPQLNYKYAFAKNQFDVLVGTTIQQSNSRGLQTTGFGYSSDAVMENPASANKPVLGPAIATTYRYNALFGRIGYTFDDKYLVNLTGRRDGSSRFGSENRFENFGSVALGWIFSKEEFIVNAIPVLSFGKLKFSYGTTGSDQIGDYRFLDLYYPYVSSVPYQGGSGLAPLGIPNPFLQWESTKKMNFGADLGFIKDRILFNFNYFQNRSSNQLTGYSLPSLTGYTSILRNFPALIQNNGWELTLNTVNIKTANFEWSTGINLTLPKNKLLRYDNLENSSDANSFKVGLPITVSRVFHLVGVDPATGVYKFADKDGHPTDNPDITDAINPYINTAPTLFGGFQNSFSYKGFNLDFLFWFSRSRSMDSYSMGDIPGINGRNQPVSILNAWHQTGDIAPYQRTNSDFSIIGQFFTASQSTDAAFRDASFIRLKNVSLSWSFPKIWNDRMHLNNTRIFAQGQNLLTITSYKGMDPESTGVGLPPLRVITFGLQVGL